MLQRIFEALDRLLRLSLFHQLQCAQAVIGAFGALFSLASQFPLQPARLPHRLIREALLP
jgi:hypothetical protein